MANAKDIRTFREKYKVYITAGIIAWILSMFFHPIGISGDAMSPTINDGQIVVVSKQHYTREAPDLYEIVDFNKDFSDKGGNNANEVRRVVGVPGDRIEIKSGIVYRNGKAIKAPYDKVNDGEEMKAVKLKKGEIFVLGDDPAESIDSRQVGPLQMSDIRGKCTWIMWPLSDWGAVK